MKRWLITATAVTVSIGLAIGGGLWEKRAEPENGIPQTNGPDFHLTAETQRLVEAAKLYDYETSPKFTLHIEQNLRKELSRQMVKTITRMGWYAQRRRTPQSDLVITLPAGQMQEVERMAENPREWLQEKGDQPPARSAPDEPLTNVTIEIDGFRAHAVWPALLMGAGISGTLIFTTAGIWMFLAEHHPSSRGNRRKERTRRAEADG